MLIDTSDGTASSSAANKPFRVPNRSRRATKSEIRPAPSAPPPFAEEQGSLIALPAHPCDAAPTVERRPGRDGTVTVGGNLHSVPDAARKRVLEVQRHPAEVRIFEDRRLIARHPVLKGRNRRRVDPSHRMPLRRPPCRSLRTRRSGPWTSATP